MLHRAATTATLTGDVEGDMVRPGDLEATGDVG